MMPSDPPPALREFIAHRSESSFRELVREHSPQVFATALRKLGGNRAAAQDVTQEVFTLLARKAHRLESVVLGGWLYRQTCRRAANHVRTESRRKSRENAAMTTPGSTTPAEVLDSRLLARELDDAMLTLPSTDRDALVLRYFEGKEYRAIGQCLGLGEEATRKRIQRALDRLGVSLKRRGIAAGSISLGTALEGFGAPAVSAEMVSRLTASALQTTAGSAALTTLLKPMLAGVLATSLVSGTALALRSPAEPTTPAAAHGVSPRDSRTTQRTDSLADDLTLEQIIIEIKRGTSGPSNSLSAMRLRAILGKIAFEDAEAFFKLAATRLDSSEKAATYQVLLEGWMKQNPAAVMQLTLTEKIGDQVDFVNGTNALLNLFLVWTRNDSEKPQEWLHENWEEETLKETAFEGSLRNFLAAVVAKHRFSKDEFDSAFEFISRIPSLADQELVLRSLFGPPLRHRAWQHLSGDEIMIVHRKLKEFPDPKVTRKLVIGLWTNLGQNRPDMIQELEPGLNDQERFEMALGLLSVKARPTGSASAFNGGTITHFEPVDDGPEREQAAMDAGIAAGLTRSETFSAIGRELSKSRGFFDWFDNHSTEISMDETLAEFARKEANSSGWSKGREMIAMEWARRISDPVLRRKLSRAIFRKSLSRFPDAAVDYLNKAELPSDLAVELKAIIHPTP